MSDTQPAAVACRCDRPAPTLDPEDDEVRCIACGRLSTDDLTKNTATTSDAIASRQAA